MAWRLHAKFKNLKGKAFKRQWKLKILPPPRKENAKAREAAALEEGGFAVSLPTFTLRYTASLPKTSRISVSGKLVLFTLLSVKLVIINFPPVFWKSAVEKNLVQKVPQKTDGHSQSPKFQSTSLLLLRHKTRGPSPLGRAGAKTSRWAFQCLPTTWNRLHPTGLQSLSVWGRSTERTWRGTVEKQWRSTEAWPVWYPEGARSSGLQVTHERQPQCAQRLLIDAQNSIRLCVWEADWH